MRSQFVLSLVAVGLVVVSAIALHLSLDGIETAGGQTEIRTGAMLGGGHDPRWFYVRVGGGAWQPTYAGTGVEGRLLNFRAANAIFDDENNADFDAQANTAAFISNLDAYKEHGILAFTISLQGGNPGYDGALASAFNPDGSLKSEWMNRAAQVIEAADSRGQIVILTYFYFRQDEVLEDPDAVRAAVSNATDWLIANNYRNVIIEIANEHNFGPYDHDIIKSNTTINGIGELITLAKSHFDGLGWRLPVSASRADITFSNGLRATADLALVHGNAVEDWNGDDTYSSMKVIHDANAVPVVMNEDDNGSSPGNQLLDRDTHALTDAINAGGSWGLMWAEYNQYQPFEWSLGNPAQLNTESGYFHAILDQFQIRVSGSGGTPGPSTPTVEPTAPGTTIYGLEYSLASDRSGGLELRGATLSGDVYIFVTPADGLDVVEFYLDGEPVQTENNPPFDFAGTVGAVAYPWDTTEAADGQHTVEALLFLNDGSIASISATVTIANSQSEPTSTLPPTPAPSSTPTASATGDPPPSGAGNYELVYSLSSDRSDPLALEGATVSGSIYPYLTSDQTELEEVDRVDYYLDGKHIQTEENPPHDFGSGTVSTAKPWNTNAVEDGQHTIEARLLMNEGSTMSVSATFIVSNFQSEPTPTNTPSPSPIPTEEPTASPTEEPTAPETVDSRLVYSHSPHRTNPIDLDGATVSRTIHVFLTSDDPSFAEIDWVDFFLDGEYVQTEENPPHDFGSGTVASAIPWDTTTVPDGQHTIEAVQYFDDGTRASTFAQFTVENELSGQ